MGYNEKISNKCMGVSISHQDFCLYFVSMTVYREETARYKGYQLESTHLCSVFPSLSLLLQGIFVLGLPFALVHSGYVGLVLMVLSAWVCNHTGRILVACLYEEEQ